MRNKYPGKCIKCTKVVRAGDGDALLRKGQFRVQHIRCREKESSFHSIQDSLNLQVIDSLPSKKQNHSLF